LDTRSKITSPSDVLERLAGKPARWVAGHFDPLLAEHVRRLRECVSPGEALVVEVTNPTSPFLPQRARAELVAALAMVDYVVLENGQRIEQAGLDDSLTERFVEQVQKRHRGESLE